MAQSSDLLDTKISIQLPNTELINILDIIAEKAGCTFSYNSKALEGKKASANYRATPLKEILLELLGPETQFQTSGRQIFIRLGKGVGSVVGTVKTDNGLPGAFSTIRLRNTPYRVMTDSIGYYRLSDIPIGNYTLEYSGMGYVPYNTTIEIAENNVLTLNITVQAADHLLDEITVTGNRPVVTDSSEYVAKLPLSNMENAQVYTGITNTLIVQQKIYNITDAVSNVPGITILGTGTTNSADYGGATFSSRGFTTKSAVFNGLALNMYSSHDVANLEKIEVIKGPSATLFGNIVSSYGGLVNRVTKKPYELQGGSVEMAGGSYGFHRIAIDMNTPLNTDHTFLSRLNAVYQNQNSFQDNGGYYRDILVAPSFRYRMNDRMTINLNTEINHSKNAGAALPIYFNYVPSVIKGSLSTALAGFGLPDETIQQIIAAAPATVAETFGITSLKDFGFDPSRSYSSNDLVSTNHSVVVSPEVHYDLATNWKSTTSAIFGSAASEGYSLRISPVPTMIPVFLAGITEGRFDFGTPGIAFFERDARKYTSNLETYQIQQNFTGDFAIGSLRNRMVIGLDYYHRRTSSYYDNFVGSLFGIPQEQTFDMVNATGETPNYYDFNRLAIEDRIQRAPGTKQNFSDDQSVYSSYINNVLNITGQVIASAGLRIDRFINKGVYNGTVNETNGAYRQTALAPKFGLIYQPLQDRIALFGNYQTSFTNQEGSNFEGTPFRPEKAYQWEGGVKTSFFDGHFTSTLSYYDIRVEDKVRTDINHPLFRIQDGTQISRGMEVEVLGNPIPDLNILLGYAYNNSKMTKADPLVEGLRPIEAGPEHQLNFWVHYHFNELTPLNGFSIGFGGNYAGETFTVNYYPDGALAIPAYTVLNAKLSFDRPKYSFGVRVNNLTNERFWRGSGTILPQMPRQFLATLGIKI
ncbi:TonB-dependent receptor [Parapedobacter koreensis]|nr:TonB-dependent receptor [Parapedobacter koreensis]